MMVARSLAGRWIKAVVRDRHRDLAGRRRSWRASGLVSPTKSVLADFARLMCRKTQENAPKPRADAAFVRQ
jgi:hypothetical protein